MDPNDWTLTGNAGTDPTTNFLGTTDNEPLVINPVGNANIGTFDSVIPYPKLTVTGPDATVNVETAEILRVMRHGVPGVKNQNSAGFFVGAFEPGIDGRSRLDINVAGTPGDANTWGSVPDVTVMSLLGNGNVGIGTSNPIAQLDVSSTGSTSSGVRALGSFAGAAVVAESNGVTGTGILAAGPTLAGQFNGNVDINGDLNVSGAKSFKIDHPLDAAKKYLYHASVESSEMKNIYDGVVVLDARGEAEVTLSAWFDALNTDFRYQLTAIGAAGPDLYIAEEMSANRFKIAGGRPNMKVCWQMTGVRQDAWAKANPLPVEQDKPAQEQGYYLHPELYGESDEKSIVRARYPELEILRAR